MREDLSREKMHKAIDTTLSGLNGDPWLFRRVASRAAEGEIKVKRKLSTGLVLAIILILIAAAAIAITVNLLTHQDVVEQVAVPLAVSNDTGTAVNNTYSATELAELVRSLNENGITLDESNVIMQLIQNGQGYYEEETIMEICRQAFGGYIFTWTLEQQDWYDNLMVQIGFYETHQSRVPGPDNMTYPEAEAFAFRTLRDTYGSDLPLEDRNIWTLSRQFYLENPDDPATACWSFSLDPKDIDHSRYTVEFRDSNPDGTVYTGIFSPDWSGSYSGEDLLMAFYSVYTWNQGKWPQSAWQRLHDMMQRADLQVDDYQYTSCLGYQLTAYPDPDETDISREQAIQIAREALNLPRAALDSAVLTEYDHERSWIIGMVIYPPDEDTQDPETGTYAIAVDSRTGSVISLRKASLDDDVSFAFVPEAAYEKAWEGVLKPSDYIRLAANAIQEKYPELDPLDENEFKALDWGGSDHEIHFITRNIRHGNASASVASDGTVTDITADTDDLNGGNLFDRYCAVFGYFGQWDQAIWVQLDQNMQALEPTDIDGKLLKANRYPDESTVRIQHGEAQELGMKATGKRTAEVNTCVLVSADPHPVWIMRILTDDPDDPVIGIDAETGDVAFTELFRVDYTPKYVLYSLPETWRKTELETYGAEYIALTEITHRYADMWLDEPDMGLDNEADWELQQNGLIVRFIGRWKGMKQYEVELDENGFVLRCEESESPSEAERPEDPAFENDDTEEYAPMPIQQPDEKP